MNRITVIVVPVVCLVLAGAAQAQKAKGDPAIGGELFFFAKGSQPLALERVYPGITAALMLTAEQKEAIMEAQRQTVFHPDVRAAMQLGKSGPDVTEAQREEARKTVADARQRLRAAVDEVLTPAQKALIAAIQKAYEESQRAAMEALGDDLKAAKGNPDRSTQVGQRFNELVREEMSRRLENVLTAEQQAAVQRAALVQLEAEEMARNSKKSKGGGI